MDALEYVVENAINNPAKLKKVCVHCGVVVQEYILPGEGKFYRLNNGLCLFHPIGQIWVSTGENYPGMWVPGVKEIVWHVEHCTKTVTGSFCSRCGVPTLNTLCDQCIPFSTVPPKEERVLQNVCGVCGKFAIGNICVPCRPSYICDWGVE